MNTGGPAFPSSNDVVIGNVGTSGHTGMSLRDYFATAAIQGLLAATRDDEVVNYHIMAPSAYRCADAMLAAREAK